MDDTTTVIDGGKIITGSIDANTINANTISGSSLTISDFKDSDDYLNSNIPMTKTVNTNYNYSLDTWLIYAAEGHSDTWTNISATDNGLKVGDMVIVKGTELVSGGEIHVLITIDKINSSGKISLATSHGLIDSGAGRRASNYIFADSSGIKIASMSPSTASTYQRQTSSSTEFYINNNKKSVINGDGLEIFTEKNSNIVSIAKFGSIVKIGEENKSHLEMDFHSMQLIDKNNKVYFYISDLRDENGYAEIIEYFIGDGSTKEYELSMRTEHNISEPVVKVDGTEVEYTLTTTKWSETIITLTNTPINSSLIEITYLTKDDIAKAYTIGLRKSDNTIGGLSVATGYDVVASGTYSHAEGNNTAAEGRGSHSEGHNTIAKGEYSHTEGYSTRANGSYSHAEGYNTMATAVYSHAEGHDTIANGGGSHAEG